jgi:hypothetical protein
VPRKSWPKNLFRKDNVRNNKLDLIRSLKNILV